MATTLSARAVGSTVTLEVDGSSRTFRVVHQGNPDPDLYDASCDGAWLLLDDLYATRSWGSAGSYPDSDLHAWLNETFLALLDTSVQAAVKSVKLPYWDRSAGAFQTGADGFEAKVFLLSGSEIGWEAAKLDEQDLGVALAYFEGSGSASAPIRVAYLGGSAKPWWTRDPDAAASNKSWYVMDNGNGTVAAGTNSYGIRPAIILPGATQIDDSGAVIPNAPPTITSPSGASGVNLGVKSAPFLFEYTAADPDGGSLTLTEKVDGAVTRTLTAAAGTAQSFEAVGDSLGFLKLGSGAHTLQAEASDGVASASLTAVFTKSVSAASLTLAAPLTASSPIKVAVLTVGGSIPADADYSVEVTNNALDPAPVWQDATDEVRQGGNIVFSNRTAAESPAFNFRIQAARGLSGTGGYIDSVTGAFQ